MQGIDVLARLAFSVKSTISGFAEYMSQLKYSLYIENKEKTRQPDEVGRGGLYKQTTMGLNFCFTSS